MKLCVSFFVLLFVSLTVAQDEWNQDRLCPICKTLAASIGATLDPSSGPASIYIQTLQSVCMRIPAQALKERCESVVETAKTSFKSISTTPGALCRPLCEDGVDMNSKDILSIMEAIDSTQPTENTHLLCRYCKTMYSLLTHQFDLDRLLKSTESTILSLCVQSKIGDEKQCQEAIDEVYGLVEIPTAKHACAIARLCDESYFTLVT
eukprot:g3638.t1